MCTMVLRYSFENNIEKNVCGVKDLNLRSSAYEPTPMTIEENSISDLN